MNVSINTATLGKIFNTTILALSGILALLFVGNLVVHFLLYLVDGSVEKFLSPTWMYVNGIMVFFSLVFLYMLKRERRA